MRSQSSILFISHTFAFLILVTGGLELNDTGIKNDIAAVHIWEVCPWQEQPKSEFGSCPEDFQDFIAAECRNSTVWGALSCRTFSTRQIYKCQKSGPLWSHISCTEFCSSEYDDMWGKDRKCFERKRTCEEWCEDCAKENGNCECTEEKRTCYEKSSAMYGAKSGTIGIIGTLLLAIILVKQDEFSYSCYAN